MRHTLPRRAHLSRRLWSDARGATITEYALMIFLVAVVAAGGFRVFGSSVGGGVTTAENNLKSTDPPPKVGDNGSGAGEAEHGGTTLRTSHGARAGGDEGARAAETFGGPRSRAQPKEESQFAKFAMIALGVIGAAAAFFAAMKGKHAR